MRRLIEPSHLDLCCLQKPIIIAYGSERVNKMPYFRSKIREIYFKMSSSDKCIVEGKGCTFRDIRDNCEMTLSEF